MGKNIWIIKCSNCSWTGDRSSLLRHNDLIENYVYRKNEDEPNFPIGEPLLCPKCKEVVITELISGYNPV